MSGSMAVFFTFATGIKNPITVPLGLLAHCQEHVRYVEEALGLELGEPYRDNPRHWKRRDEARCEHDKVLCIVASDHNAWIRWLHDSLGRWASEPEWWTKPVPGGRMALWGADRPLVETFDWGTRVTSRYHCALLVPLNPDRTPQTEVLTPEQAQTFWHGLQAIDVPVGRWTEEFYRDRMDHLYEVLRGREHEGASIDCDPLTPEQVADVVWLLDTGGYIPSGGLDLDVPQGCDGLSSADEYKRCTICGAVDLEELCEHLAWCEDCEDYTGPGSEHLAWCEHHGERDEVA